MGTAVGSTSWRALKCKMAEAEQQRQQPSTGEEEPLLGGVGDATQQQRPIYHNFVLGTGVVAQAGAWILAAIVWGSVFSHDLILFSVHPLLNSAAVLFFVQGILILQPTHTAAQKKQGTYTRHLHSYRTASDRRDNTVLHA